MRTPRPFGLTSMLLVFLVVLNGVLFFTWFLNGSAIEDLKLSGEAAEDYSEVAELAGKSWGFKEYADYFYQLAQEKGAAYAYQVLKVAPVKPGTDMHLLGHVVSDEIYKQEGIPGIQVCDHDFRNACSHAIVVGIFLEHGIGALPKIQEACMQAPGGKGAYDMCFHGLGHGVLAYYEYEMEKAVEACQQIDAARTGRESVECVSGIVMEMMAGVNDPEAWEEKKSDYLVEGEPLTPCTLEFVPEEAQPMCYVYLTPRLFESAGMDLGSPEPEYFKTAFTFCEEIPEEKLALRNACFGGFGKEFVVLVKERDVRNIEAMTQEELSRAYEWCELAPHEEALRACVEHAVNSLFWGGENDRSVAVNYCGLISDEATRGFCFTHLTGAVRYYIDSTEYREAFCSELPAEHQTQCQEELRLSS